MNDASTRRTASSRYVPRETALSRQSGTTASSNPRAILVGRDPFDSGVNKPYSGLALAVAGNIDVLDHASCDDPTGIQGTTRRDRLRVLLEKLCVGISLSFSFNIVLLKQIDNEHGLHSVWALIAILGWVLFSGLYLMLMQAKLKWYETFFSP